MNGIITTARPAANNLPVAVNTEIQRLLTSPEKYLETLPAERVQDAQPPGALMISRLKRGLPREQQIMAVSLLIIEVNDFFNVKGNMNAKQIKITAEMILDNPGFFDLTLGNIKACFRQRMMGEKIYDRIDGNIIIGWLRQFKSDMADWCENFNLGRDRERERKEMSGGAGAISHNAYLAMLEARANDGDQEAQKILDTYHARASATPSKADLERKEAEFRKYKFEYLKSKGYFDKQ